jgi:hypothetical protein
MLERGVGDCLFGWISLFLRRRAPAGTFNNSASSFAASDQRVRCAAAAAAVVLHKLHAFLNMSGRPAV